MSKYEETVDSCNRICPYCGYSYQVEDYSENPYEEECDGCGKKYYAYETFSVDSFAKPDCELNGEKHKWEPLKITVGYHDFCSICGECRPFDDNKPLNQTEAAG